jgi:hypothetical protein
MRFIRAALSLVLLCAQLLAPVALSADSGMIVIGGAVSTGVQASVGVCPCIRFNLQASLPGGVIQTQSVWVSVSSLLEFSESELVGLRTQSARSLRALPLDVLLSGGKWGVSFSGLEWGMDLDRGLTDVFRTAVGVLYQRIASEAVVFRMKSSAQIESFRLNGSDPLTRNTWLNEAELFWQTEGWTGRLRGYVGFDSGEYLPLDLPKLGFQALAQWKLFDVHDLALSLGGGVQFDRVPFRDLGGMNPNDLRTMITVEASYWPTPAQGGTP